MEPVLTLHELMIGILTILILVFLVILALLIFSFREYKIVESRQLWKKLVEEYLANVIIEGSVDEVYVDTDITYYLKYREFRRYFLNRLVESERKFSGVAAEILQRVFYIYHLNEEAYALLRSKKPYLIARGIQVLTVMRAEEALPEIKSMLNHNHLRVRQEAQYAIVYFEGFEGLAFLDQFNGVLSDWQQLRIISFIKRLPKDAIPRLLSWLYGENPSVIIFSLKLIQKFKVLELHADLIQILNYPNHAVQLEVIRTMFSLDVFDTSEQLVARFPFMEEAQQQEIIKGLGYTRARDQIDFLKKELSIYPTQRGRVNIADALLSIGEFNYLNNLKLSLKEGDPNLLVVNHVLDNKR